MTYCGHGINDVEVMIMTYHSFSKWTPDDEVTDEVVDEVVEGLEYHLKLNNGEQYTPGAYIKMCSVDACIHFVGTILDTQARGEEIDVDKLIGKSSESAQALIRRVLERMACNPDKP